MPFSGSWTLIHQLVGFSLTPALLPCSLAAFLPLSWQLDRLILELRLTPMEAWWHLQRVLERLNAICSSLITSETFRLDETEAFADGLEKVKGTQIGRT